MTTTVANTTKSKNTLEELCSLLIAGIGKKDEEIRPQFYSLWRDFDQKDINEKNSRGQTLLYAGCRSGRFWVVEQFIRVPNIKIDGPQENRYCSTALHGANWGGFLDILALLIMNGATPQKNTNKTATKTGFLPEEEGNKELGKEKLVKIKEFWTKYNDKGKDGIKDYLPADYTPISADDGRDFSNLFNQFDYQATDTANSSPPSTPVSPSKNTPTNELIITQPLPNIPPDPPVVSPNLPPINTLLSIPLPNIPQATPNQLISSSPDPIYRNEDLLSSGAPPPVLSISINNSPVPATTSWTHNSTTKSSLKTASQPPGFAPQRAQNCQSVAFLSVSDIEEASGMPPTPAVPSTINSTTYKPISKSAGTYLSGTKSMILSVSAPAGASSEINLDKSLLPSNTASYYDKELKPAYRDFEYIFVCEGAVVDLKTTSILNKAKQNNITEVTLIKAKNKKFTYDLHRNEQIDHSKNKRSELKCFSHPPVWYYRSSDATITAYEHDVNMLICNHILRNQVKLPLKLVIRRQRHELDIESRSDFNSDTKEGFTMFSDKELKDKKFYWTPEFDDSMIKETKVEELPNGTEEFSKVADLFYLTMPRRAKGVNEEITEITSIEKIWNPALRRNWDHELKNVKLANDENQNIRYTRMLFHGTGNCDPKIIYEDDKGFLINYASDDGLWGRGVYFAQDASYSHKYSYRTKDGICKMILAQVITGDGINLDEDRNIRLPPLKDEGGKKRFDCVIGMRHGTFIYVCYDNGRAYPTYVIGYKRKDL